ncbi:DUF748 domain-containing protein [Pseudomonadota bacterium]
MHISSAGALPPVTLTDLELRVQNLINATGAHGNFTLTSTINRSARLEGKGWLAPADAEIEADLSISGVDAAGFGGYIDLGPAVELASARLAANVGLSFKENRMRLNGEAEIRDIEVVDALKRSPVFTADTLRAVDIVIDPSSQPVFVKSIKVETPDLKITRDTAEQPGLLQWLLPGVSNHPKLHAAQFGRLVGTIEIVGGRAEFTDLSTAPNVRIVADQISGTLTHDDAGPETSASLKLDGKLNESGKVSLRSSWSPYVPDHSITANLILRDTGLPELSPYFHSFTGREITHGVLNLELDCEISDRQLEIQDRLLVDDLVLGSQAKAPTGSDLPLDLALALLKDDNGLLSLSIPVVRTPVDEEFDLPAAQIRARLTNQVANDRKGFLHQAGYKIVRGPAKNSRQVKFLVDRGTYNRNRQAQKSIVVLEQRQSEVKRQVGPSRRLGLATKNKVVDEQPILNLKLPVADLAVEFQV